MLMQGETSDIEANTRRENTRKKKSNFKKKKLIRILFMERSRLCCFLPYTLKTLYLFYLSVMLESIQKANLPQSAQFPFCLACSHSSHLTPHGDYHPT